MTHVILVSLAASLGINAVLFLIAFKLASDKLTDISYAISFLTLDIIALYYASSLDAYSIVLFLLAAIWSVRIGAFLLVRVLAVGKDQRFDGIRESFIRFGKFWFGQAITAWVLMLPVTIALYKGGTIGVLPVLAIIIWAAGLAIEAAADYQKFAFKKSGAGDTWIQSGLWKYARHPNYFGEITVWAGIYIYTFSALHGIERLIGLCSPLLIAALLLFVSGVPMLEKNADKRWGKRKEYRDYKARTRLLVPLPIAKR